MQYILQSNLAMLARALQAVGADRAEGDYSGSNDQGGLDSLRILREDGLPATRPGDVTFRMVERCYCPGDRNRPGGFIEQGGHLTTSFQTAFGDILEQVLDAQGLDGWELNAGGHGQFTVFADGRASFNHNGRRIRVIDQPMLDVERPS